MTMVQARYATDISLGPRAKEASTAIGKVFNIVRISPRGVTADEISLRLPSLCRSTVSDAVSRLAARKMIVATDETRPTRYGKPAKVYRRR